jgi:hypothetical protein
MPTTKEQRLVVRPELRRVTQPPHIAGPLGATMTDKQDEHRTKNKTDF